MKSGTFLILATAASVIAGCTSTGQQSALAPVDEARGARHATSAYQVLFDFESSLGANPIGGLTALDGKLYGTTQNGGSDGYGTVFSLTTAGKEKVLHNFTGGTDGEYPSATLAAAKSTLYGTTAYGGGHGTGEGDGTVFAIKMNGTEHVLHAFTGSPDGYYPGAGVIVVGSVLYGTTEYGGLGCQGTGYGSVYDVTLAGKEAVLDAFKCNGDNGADPESNLASVSGAFYGTTYASGGSIFRVSKGGALHTLHVFGGSGDGEAPVGGLIYANGAFYGTTTLGGDGNCAVYGTPGCGTVFAITASGKESVLYSFKGGDDGAYPFASLTMLDGTLYGTTRDGGGSRQGTVFAITTSGSESVLHSFAGSDGAYPYAPLLAHGGMLYGTTSGGGTYGAGTVFSVKP
jgi:uncharacterized repeat protein (TIGR03803 family)